MRLSFLLFIINITLGSAQSVNSKAYDVMLQSLLSHNVEEIAVGDIKAPSKYIFLDAREKNEFNVSHLKNAQWVGYDTFDPTSVSKLSKDTPIIVYCSVGYRSEKIAEKLIALGFDNVKNLYGGIFEWANQSNPVYNSKGTTSNIHAYDRTWGVWLEKGKKIYQ